MVISRRQLILSMPATLGGASIVSACTRGFDIEGYDALAARTWRTGPLTGLEGGALSLELIRYATLAPSSHNT